MSHAVIPPEVCSSAQEATLDRVALGAVLYLLLPNFLFLLGWVSLPQGLVLSILLIGAVWKTFAGKVQAVSDARYTVSLGLPVLAVVWCWLSGAGHFCYTNTDWFVRDAVLRDLSSMPWPVHYAVGGDDILLRCPMGFYLPAAALAKLAGVKSAIYVLGAWTVWGVWLFLRILPIGGRSLLQLALALVILVFFSGMDFAGIKYSEMSSGVASAGFFPPLGTHLEWWASEFQYSSNTTLLFWVPNHVLPAWIAMAVFLRYGRRKDYLPVSALVLAAVALWSPFAVMGMAPFMLLAWWRLRADWVSTVKSHWLVYLASGPLLLLSYLFLSAGAKAIPFTVNALDMSFVRDYLPFVLFEFGLMLLMLWRPMYRAELLISALMLFILPLARFGPGNDLVMRVSIPALLYLCFSCICYLTRRPASAEDVLRQGCLWGLLLIGSVTAFNEMARAVLNAPLPFSMNQKAIQAMPEIPPHYFVKLPPHSRQFLFLRGLPEAAK